MDPIKQSLIDAAGQLDASERNVQAKVRANLTKKPIRMPIWIPALAIACFIAFVGIQYLKPDTTPIQTISSNLTSEDYEYLYELMQSSTSTHVEEFQLSFVADIAYQHYSTFKGIALDEKELARRIEVEKKTLLEESEIFRLVSESDQNFEAIYLPHYVKSRYYEELLLEQLKTEYPSFNTSTLEHMLQFEAVKYFASLEESAQFLPYDDIMSIAYMNYSDYHRLEAAVMSVHEDHFIVVKDGNYFELNELTTDQIASFSKGVYKIPIEYMDKFYVGDMVQLYFPDYYMVSDSVQEMIPIQVTKALLNLTLEDEANESLLALIEPLERTQFKSIPPIMTDYALVALDAHFIFNYDIEEGIFTFYKMNSQDVEKIIVPKHISESIYELFKLGKINMKPMFSYDELVSLPSDELLDIFVHYGLKIGDDLSHLDQKQIGQILKSEFDLMIQGTTSLSSEGYMQMAKDVQRIYNDILMPE